MPTRAPGKPPPLLAAALAYYAAGRTVFPVAAGTKWPSLPQSTGVPFNLPWKEQYGATPPDVDTVTRWFTPALRVGVSLACGRTSGLWREGVTYALEVIDVDAKHAPDLYDEFLEACHYAGLTDVVRRVVLERTPGFGGHLGYLTPVCEGNLTLARMLSPAGLPVTLIETRGEGGQVVVAPTPPGIHPDYPERGYVLVQGAWEDPPVLLPAERQALFEVARSFHTYVAPERVVSGALTPGPVGHRPGDKLNALADDAWWAQTLEPHGWTRLGARRGIAYWQRPGKAGKGCSATLGACGPYFYVFSSNAAPFEPDTAYSPFAAYTLLEHGGDFTASTRALGAMSQGTYVVEGAPAPVTPTVNGTVPVGWAPALVPGARGQVSTQIPGLVYSAGKAPKPLQDANNITLFLRHHPYWQGKLWWDTVHQSAMLGEEALSEQGLLESAVWFGSVVEMSIRSLALLERCMTAHAQCFPRDVIQHWLGHLPPWDQVPRLATWLIDYAGAAPSPYSRMVGRAWLTGMVARALIPGCVCRDTVILEGAENIGKSTLVHLIGAPWCKALSASSLEGKESHMILQGLWLAEFPDLNVMSRTDESRLKAFLTQTTDTWIPKYSNFVRQEPRRTLFVGTINPTGPYLQGQTGNTRFLPVPVTQLRLDALEAVRVALFAEALATYQAQPATWWAIADEDMAAASAVRETRRIPSIFEDDLAAWLTQERFDLFEHRPSWEIPLPGVTSWKEIAIGFLQLATPEKWSNVPLQKQVAAALHTLGWSQRVTKVGGKATRLWYAPVTDEG